MKTPGLVHIPNNWVEKFLTSTQLSGTQLGGWIAVRAGRFRAHAGTVLHCELEILCRYEALNRPLLPNLEAEARSILAQLPSTSAVQIGFLSDAGELQPLLGGEPALPGTAARIDVLKEAAACFALEQFIPDSRRRGRSLAIGTTGRYERGGDMQYALPHCVRFACSYNRESAPEDPFQFLDLLLRESRPAHLDSTQVQLADAARAELTATFTPLGNTLATAGADSRADSGADSGANSGAGAGTGAGEDSTGSSNIPDRSGTLNSSGNTDSSAAARQLYGIVAYSNPRRPALLRGVVRHADSIESSPQTESRVLVCERYIPEYETHLARIDVLIEEEAGRLSPGALAARRHGVACVNGISDLSQLLHEGSEVFIDQRQGIITVPHQ